MSVDRYAGSAGGQPRLLIPTINQIVDPSVRIAMNAILRWANTLLLGGSSSSLNFFGQYHGASPGGGGTVTWTLLNSNFTYVTSGTDIVFPTDTISLLIVRTSNSFSGGWVDPPKSQLLLTSTSGTLEESAFESELVTSDSDAWAASPTLAHLWDTTFDTGAPLQVTAAVVGRTGFIVNPQMTLLSWEHP